MVSKNYKEDEQLAKWVRAIREKKTRLLKKGIEVEEVPPGKIFAKTLTAERLDRLNSIQFVWFFAGRKGSHSSVDFDIMFQRLVQYKEDHGDCMVSKNYKEDEQLAKWVRAIREKKTRLLKKGIEVEEVPPGKIFAKTLTAERLDRLNSIEFAWSGPGAKVALKDWFQDFTVDFDIMFERLAQYKEEHGDCMVSKNYKEDAQLAKWVHGMREKKASMIKKGIEVEEVPPGEQILATTLTAERLQNFKIIEFVWSVAGPKIKGLDVIL